MDEAPDIRGIIFEILLIAQWGGCYSYSHVAEEKGEAQGVSVIADAA